MLHRPAKPRKANRDLTRVPWLLAYAFTCYKEIIGCLDVSCALEIHAIASQVIPGKSQPPWEGDVSQFVA
jgi:hypothetical protein